MWKRLLAMLFTATLIAAGCGDDASDATGGSDAAVDLQLAPSELGEILVDADGNTLYLLMPDGQGDSTCYEECEANWPIVGELATISGDLDAGLLGTSERTTGEKQATYNGWPLYRFGGDSAAGDTNGQGLKDVWFVLDADGNAIGAG